MCLKAIRYLELSSFAYLCGWEHNSESHLVMLYWVGFLFWSIALKVIIGCFAGLTLEGGGYDRDLRRALLQGNYPPA